MAEGERAQERPQRRGGAHPGEQPVHAAVAQHRHVIDAVRTRDHPRDQAGDLHRSVAPTRPSDPHVPGDQLLKPGPLREAQDRCQARARHEIGVIETCRDAVTDSHLPGAFLLVLS